ncbi:uncharacterized protein [Epargyreus clarus]|uniref:uncharacterized protein n=1 Tax=Epargyreus clarus TaxID=520877 RepID=UPI003C2FC838
MRKAGSDPKVKKTLVRNYEQKTHRERVIYDVDASSSKAPVVSKENQLEHPTLCSSEALAKYLVDAKKSLPSVPSEDLNVDKGQLTAKMTKKLNFHFNDRIFRNLVELNADTASLKSKRDKKPSRPSSVKKDLEPKIEDFFDDEDEIDVCPNIPVMKPKFKPVRPVENGQLHRIVSSFECL